jgi:hypothetical protein
VSFCVFFVYYVLTFGKVCARARAGAAGAGGVGGARRRGECALCAASEPRDAGGGPARGPPARVSLLRHLRRRRHGRRGENIWRDEMTNFQSGAADGLEPGTARRQSGSGRGGAGGGSAVAARGASAAGDGQRFGLHCAGRTARVAAGAGCCAASPGGGGGLLAVPSRGAAGPRGARLRRAAQRGGRAAGRAAGPRGAQRSLHSRPAGRAASCRRAARTGCALARRLARAVRRLNRSARLYGH